MSNLSRVELIESEQIEKIKVRLSDYKKRFFRRELLKGVAICFVFVFLSYFVITSLEFWGHFSSSVRAFLFFGFLISSLALLVYLVGIPAYNLFSAHKKMSDEKAAIQLGQFFPSIQDRLLNLIQLQKLDTKNSSLILASIEQKSQEFQSVSFERAIDFTSVKKYATLLIGVLAFLLILFFLKKELFTKGTQRVIQYNQYFETPAPFNFVLVNQNLEVNRNKSFTFLLQIEGEVIPEQSKIVINDKAYVMRSGKDASFSFELKHIKKETPFRFLASGYYSKPFLLSVIDQAEINSFSISLDFPSYQNRPSESINNTGSFSIPEGTLVNWEVNASNTPNVELVFDENDTLSSIKKQEDRFVSSKRIRSNTAYSFLLGNKKQNEQKNLYQIDVLKDQHPSLKINEYADTVLNNYVFFSGSIADDYGFSKLEIEYEIIDKEKGTRNKGKKLISNSFVSENENFNYTFNLDSIGLEHGQSIEYSVSVWDNDGINGPKKTKSNTFNIKLPSSEELANAIAKSEKKQDKDLASLEKELKNLQKELSNLNEQLKSKKKLSWQDKKSIQSILEKQKKIDQKIEKAKEENRNKELQKEKLEPTKPQDKDSQLLQQMVNDMEDPETKKILKELEKLLSEKNQLDQINNNLKKLEKQNQITNKSVQRTKEMLKRSLFKEKLEKTISDIEKLSKKEEELANETKKNNTSNEEALKKQAEISTEFKKLEDEIKDLEELNRSLEKPNKMTNTESDRSEIKESMKKSQEAIESGNKSDASEKQKDASDQMKKMGQKMQAMKEAMNQKMIKENIETLKIILDNLLKLSFEQESIMENLSKVSMKDPVFIEHSQKQLQLNENAKVLEDSLFALAKRATEIQEIVLEETQNVVDYMSESLRSIKNREANKIAVQQQYAMTSMNNLALLLSDILSNMQADMSSSGDSQSMSSGDPKQNGDKPQNNGEPKNGKDGSEGEQGNSSEGIGDMQKKLNEGIQKLSGGQKSGRALSEELAKLAAQQEKIRRALKKLENEQGVGSKIGKELSDLQKMMEATERDLVFKKSNSQTLKRQQDILTRLFEAEKASRKQGFENKREAEKGSPIKGKYPPEIERYLKEKRKKTELFKTVPPSLTPFYQKKVNEYFKRIDN